MTHEELRELVPLYAIDALPEDEASEVRVHLSTCEECTALAYEHTKVAGHLALLPDPLLPPSSLRERILEEAAVAGPDRTAERRRAGRSRWRKAVAVFASLVLVVLAALTYLFAQRADRQAEVLREQQQAVALVAGGSQTVRLRRGEANDGARGAVYIANRRDAAAVILTNLREPDDGVYTLWVISGDRPTRVRDFTAEDNGTVIFYVTQGIRGMDGMAVTQEPNRGNTAPEGPVVLRT